MRFARANATFDAIFGEDRNMKSKGWKNKQLRFEKLEERRVLSAIAGLPAAGMQAAAQGGVTSPNWSGYAVPRKAGAVTAVSGSWTVPAITTTGNHYASASIWVGIDGYTNSTVEQTGTFSQISDGTATYYAWYEMFPRAGVTITKATDANGNSMAAVVQPGDAITASVTYIGSGQFTSTITDSTINAATKATTENWHFSITESNSKAKRASAEWIVEGTSIILPNFGTVTFTGAFGHDLRNNRPD